MPKKTNVDAVYKRIQTEYDFKKGDMSQKRLEKFLSAGREDGIVTPDISLLAGKVKSKAIGELEPIIEDTTTVEEFRKIEEIEIKELKTNIAERKRAIEEGLSDIIRESSEKEEFESAVRDLRKLNPQKLGGIRSGQTRRAKAGFRVLFSEI